MFWLFWQLVGVIVALSAIGLACFAVVAVFHIIVEAWELLALTGLFVAAAYLLS